MKSHLLVCSVVTLALSAAQAEKFTLYRTSDRTLGIDPPAKERSEWHGSLILSKQNLKPEEYDTRRDLDFFTLEFGKPVDPFAFTVGSNGWSRKWGTEGQERDKPAMRFGRGWDRLGSMTRYRLEMDVEQSVPETEWEVIRFVRLGYRRRDATKFKVAGSGRFTFYRDCGPIGTAGRHFVNGFEFRCLTPGAKVKVHSFVIAPVTYEVTWRRTFDLKEKPFRGGLTCDRLCDFTLKVNGRTVETGNRINAQGLVKADITDALRAGANEIAFTGNFNETYGPTRIFRIEAFAVSPSGETTVVPGDGNWEWRHGDGPWRKATVLGPAGLERMPNGTLVSDSSLPLHAGPLEPRPLTRSGMPIFDAGKEAKWEVRLPPGLQGAELACDTDLRSPKAGAYEVTWTLKKDGRTLDSVTREMVVVGRLDLPEYGLGEIEAETAKRRRLVAEIDCTRKETNPTNFIDHSNWYGSGNPRLNAGRVVSLPSGRYRETGADRGDLFSYRIAVGTPGRPHILEFDYPDDGERMIYCAIMDQLSIAFCNNSPPPGTKSWPNGTGAVRCGGLMPVTGEKRTARILFFPASRAGTVYFENGLTGTRAAVSAVRVYEIEGELPALRLPRTNRLYGNHNERPLMHHWGAFVTPKIHEYGREICLGKWSAAYASVANRIRELKYFGQNASIEGGYMYSGGFPSKSGVCDELEQGFDYHELILRMYAANGIRAFLSYEYSGSPDVAVSGIRGVGDRENWAGKARPADQVDRYGRQISGHGMAVNAFHPQVWASARKAMQEMYDRYAPLGSVEGVVVQTGWLWLPCFGRISGDVTEDEVGYDDDTVEAFERDTGIRLGLPTTGGDRFPKRYALLTGRYRDAWSAWRKDAIGRKLGELAAICRGDRGTWSVWVSPNADAPAPTGLDGFGIGLLPKIEYAKELQLGNYASGFSRAARAARRGARQIYLAPTGLNEHIDTQINAPGAAWWWKWAGKSVVFETKSSGDNAMYDVALVVADGAPRTLFHTWLDVNIPTGHAEEERRAAYGFYAAPEGTGVDFPKVSGVTAKAFGDKVLLVNETPYPLSGFVKTLLSGTERIDLRPFGMRTLSARFARHRLSGEFRLDDRSRTIVEGQRAYLGMPRVSAALSDECRALLASAGSCYELAKRLRDPEVMSAVEAAFGPSGLSRFLNGREPERYDPTGMRTVLEWRADGKDAANALARLPKGALREEGGVRFARLSNVKGLNEFSFSNPSLRERLPNGRRTWEARVRLHGKDLFCQTFAPWKSRFDLTIRDGKGGFGMVAWPVDDRFHSLSLAPKYALPTDTWVDLTVSIDPEGEARLYVDGCLMGHCDLPRLHGDPIPDMSVWLSGGVSSKTDPSCSVDFAFIRLSHAPAGAGESLK